MRRAKERRAKRSTQRAIPITVGVIGRTLAERQALARSLGAEPRLLAFDCGDGTAESVRRVRDLAPAVVLVALESGPAGAFAASLQSAKPGIRSVALLRNSAEPALRRLTAAGFAGFVAPNADLAACARAIRAVHRGRFNDQPSSERVLPVGMDRTAHDGRSNDLRGRPLEVAHCLAEGLTNKEISDRLRIAEGTVKSHVHAVLGVLRVGHRWEVRAAMMDGTPRHGLAPAGSVAVRE